MSTDRVSMAKRLFDASYARLMREISELIQYWHDIWLPDYSMQPLKIENKVD